MPVQELEAEQRWKRIQVNHREQSSQRLVTKIQKKRKRKRKPLEPVALQLSAYGVQMILALIDPFSISDYTFTPSSVISLCNIRKPVL